MIVQKYFLMNNTLL